MLYYCGVPGRQGLQSIDCPPFEKYGVNDTNRASNLACYKKATFPPLPQHQTFISLSSPKQPHVEAHLAEPPTHPLVNAIIDLQKRPIASIYMWQNELLADPECSIAGSPHYLNEKCKQNHISSLHCYYKYG